jgi:two-component system phosphate regulon sensor histidine kinase PhoR
VRRRRSIHLVTLYVLSLAAAIAFLVVWVVYLVRSGSGPAAPGPPGGPAPPGVNWLLLIVGCVLLFFVIVVLTYQLAQALAARRYALKQEEFLSNITHEMKSPLAAIKLHAQTLQQPEDLAPDTRRRFAATIEQQADRMAALVDSVLESSRLLARRRKLELHPVDLSAFLAGYLESATAQARLRGVSLRHEVAPGARVLGSEEALRRVLDNLIDNAVRYSRPGGEVRCRVFASPEGVRIEVEDDGVGIPKSDLQRIFDRFYQAGRPGEPHRRGTGLGLSIVAGLVREMRGTVRAHSQEGRPGTLLVVDLPHAGGGA